VSLLSLELPATWKGKTAVSWDSKEAGQPSIEWVTKLWGFVSTSQKLAVFDGWPLVPVVGSKLCRLHLSSHLIDSHREISPHLQELLTKIGCHCLDHSFPWKHAQKHTFVHKFTISGIAAIITSLVAGDLKKVKTLFENANPDERIALRGFLTAQMFGNREIVDPAGIELLKMLPIFEVFSQQSMEFCDLSSEHLIAPPDTNPVLLTRRFLKVSAIEDLKLAQALGARQLSPSEFYRNHVFTNLQSLSVEVRDEVMQQVLRDMPSLIKGDAQFSTVVKNLAFVPDLTDSLHKATDLFDPSVPELCALLDKNTNFPKYTNDSALVALRALGLRTSIDHDGVLASTRAVMGLSTKDPAHARSLGSALLRYLDQHSERFFVHKKSSMLSRMFSDDKHEEKMEAWLLALTNTPWMPTLQKPLADAMPWKADAEKVFLASANQVRPINDAWYCSCSLFILDGHVQSPDFQKALGWEKPVPAAVIAAQLVELARLFEIGDSQAGFLEVIVTTVPKMYRILHKVSPTEFPEVQKVLQGQNWIWVGGEFVSVDKVAFKCPVDTRPYLYPLPFELIQLSDLFQKLGVRSACTSLDYAEVLGTIAQKTKGAPLEAKVLDVVVSIIQFLSDNPSELHGSIYIPNDKLILTLAPHLVFDDAPWLSGSEAFRKQHQFVYPKISNDVAEKLGVRSLRSFLINATSQSLSLGIQSATAFGQTESLTRRLRNIISLYPEGPGVLYEMIQNADDAKATEVKIMFNTQDYGSSSLLSPKMADWQGHKGFVVKSFNIRCALELCSRKVVAQEVVSLKIFIHTQNTSNPLHNPIHNKHKTQYNTHILHPRIHILHILHIHASTYPTRNVQQPPAKQLSKHQL